MKKAIQEKGFFRDVFYFSPQAAMIFDSDLEIVFKNRAADCLSGERIPSPFKNSAKEILDSDSPYKRRIVYKYAVGDEEKEISVLIKGSVFEYEGNKYALLAVQNIDGLMRTDVVVNICSNCKKIKRSQSSWQDIEEYIKDNLANVCFSHGICPDCSNKLYKTK
ncbi:MAG: hypothetical protein L6420_11365 [Elusimicrobia bacterium]|nr:hypothetical protein [Elusimicrobiota bacterium]